MKRWEPNMDIFNPSYVTGTDGSRGVYKMSFYRAYMLQIEFWADATTSGKVLSDALHAAWAHGRCYVNGKPPDEQAERDDGGTFYLTEGEAWNVQTAVEEEDGQTIPCFGSMDKVQDMLDYIV